MRANIGTKRKFSTNEFILDSLNWRYAAKRYDPSRIISDTDFETLMESLRLAPSSIGLQPYKFIVVNDRETREKLKAASGQAQFTDASHLIVFAYKKSFSENDIARSVEIVKQGWKQSDAESSGFESMVRGAAEKAANGGFLETWNSRQAYIALGFLLETAALLGIDATPMEGFDAERVNEILGLEDHSAVVAVALGYRDAENDWLAKKEKVRKEAAELFEIV